jgi:heme-degrading monooxygenase HmoA
MIRVLYHWRVSPEAAAGFPGWWHDGTVHIRSSNRGALGSTLLRSHDDPSLFVGVARWESVETLESFRQAMGTIQFDGAELESIQVFQELDDLTISLQ